MFQKNTGGNRMDTWSVIGILVILAVVALVLIGSVWAPEPVPPEINERKAAFFASQEYDRVLEQTHSQDAAERAYRITFERVIADGA